jgi:cyanophycinase
VIGSGIVTIVNGESINYTNLADINEGMPISVEHLIVHILSAGEEYRMPTEAL